MLNEAFAVQFASMMFGGSGSWGTYQVGLGRADIATLTPRSTLADLQELQAVDNPGYARANASLSVSTTPADGPDSKFSVPFPAFQNSGEQAWQPAKCIFIVCNGNWIYAQALTEIAVAAGDTFTPWAYEEGDHLIVIEWRSTNRGEPATPA